MSKKNKKKTNNNEIELWIDKKSKLYTFDSWNDEERENNKLWDLRKGGSDKLMNYLKVETTLYREYESVINFANELKLIIKGNGIDLGAGPCWTTALTSKIDLVKSLYAVDFSYQRLKNITPDIFDLFKAEKQKINLVMGDFYNIKLINNSIDFCFLSATFHHADEPERLLKEIKRVLKKDGFIMMIGENPISFYNQFIKYIKNLLKIILPSNLVKGPIVYSLIPTFNQLYPTDQDEGDHYYRLKDYYDIFNNNGFKLKQKKLNGYNIFIAKNSE